MINTLSVTIPQLTVLPQDSYVGISKKWISESEDHFLWFYFDTKMQELTVKHHWLNELIREIFLIHESSKHQRNNEEFYSQDQGHHRQLIQTRTVCEIISSITAELLYCLYYMKFIKDHQQFPIETKLVNALQNLFMVHEIKSELSSQFTFIHQAELVRQTNHINNILPSSKFILADESPTFFAVTAEGQIEKYSFSDFINSYNAFFKIIIKCLKNHSPEAIASSLERYKE